MKFSIPEDQIILLLEKQLSNFFFLSEEERLSLRGAYPYVMKRVEKNFSASPNKYYNRGNDTFFNPYHSDSGLFSFIIFHTN